MNDIATWNFLTMPSEGVHVLRLEYIDDSDLNKIISRLKIIVGAKRHGYRIRFDGSCCKGPQGINWMCMIDFDSEEDLHKFVDSLRDDEVRRDDLMKVEEFSV
jgi:hypothetical protein